jgi:hypothetical protein
MVMLVWVFTPFCNNTEALKVTINITTGHVEVTKKEQPCTIFQCSLHYGVMCIETRRLHKQNKSRAHAEV